MESVNIFSDKFHNIISERIQNVLLEGADKEEVTTPSEVWSLENDNLSCSYCRVQFPDSQTQREHYKLDWHRYNLKQSLLAKPPICEEEFNEKSGKDDLSSISGSDTEKEDTLDTYVMAQGKIFLQNQAGKVFSMYRCVLLDRKEEVPDSVLLGRLKECCITNKQWTILMLGGGHFAGAVFQGNEPVFHKTFHCYTVRAGQGGGQSSRDNKSGGSQPKSAGASLRRYNEQALEQHVRSIVDTWRPEIEKSALIIYRAAGPYNRSVLFGGIAPLLERSDKRLRTIPFSTRRAKFTEVKRVQSLLTAAEVYNSLGDASQCLSKQKSPEARSKIRSSCINRAKSRETVERPLPGTLSNSSSSDADSNNDETQDDSLIYDTMCIDFNELDDFSSYQKSLKKKPRHVLKGTGTAERLESTSLPGSVDQKKGSKKKTRKSKTKKLKEQEEARKKQLIDILIRGDIMKLETLLENYLKSAKEGEVENSHLLEDKKVFINESLDENLNTLLHIAALNEHDEIIRYLLENDANPCLKNKNQQTPYICTQSREIRETFKQFAKDNPEKYNYNKAQIPTNSLTVEESAAKKRAQRKGKKEKEKEKKQENQIKRKEEEERNRFMQLSDREKRALAAERRILSQSGTVISRCFLCGSDMAGKVPFEYMENKFCTIECLKAHRMQHPIVLS